MPTQLPDKALKNAQAAIANAKRVRSYHARRTEVGSPQREQDIQIALTRLKEAMKPIKSEIGKFPYGPQTDQAEQNRDTIRATSDAIQAERRKLWKMTKRRRT